ncbi:MAG: MBL fold metallo-hydrolase [Planctomycetia bacterium]|nr:MBL fold metallo-hydrolase [Planctomycetia bacterium]
MADGRIHFCPLCSGSSGNATYVASGKTSLLIDCGRSGRHLSRCLAEIGVELESISAVLLTHEHTDHIQAISVLARSLGIPIYASVGTWFAIMKKGKAEKIDKRCIKVFESNGALFPLDLGDLEVSFFPVPHDAKDPVGYRVSNGSTAVAIATDTGHITSEMRRSLRGVPLVLLEANHDVEMLKRGPYTAVLKRRVLSDVGHLSNDNAGLLATELATTGTKRIYLGHLSKENNRPELAWNTVASVLKANSLDPRSDVEVLMTRRDEPSRLSHVSAAAVE